MADESVAIGCAVDVIGVRGVMGGVYGKTVSIVRICLFEGIWASIYVPIHVPDIIVTVIVVIIIVL